MRYFRQYSLYFIAVVCVLWCVLLSYRQYFIKQEIEFITNFIKISKVTQKSGFIEILGNPMYTYTADNIMLEKGPIKDVDYIKNKELCFFVYKKNIPYKFIIVYFDKKTNTAKYITWENM